MSEHVVHRHKPLACRVCHAQMDASTDPTGNSSPEGPSNNSFSLCMQCGEVSVFVVEDGSVIGLREPNFAELAIFHNKFARVAQAATTVRLTKLRGEKPPSG